MKFQEKISALRKAADMSRQELADRLHIHVTPLSKMENGRLMTPAYQKAYEGSARWENKTSRVRINPFPRLINWLMQSYYSFKRLG